MKMGILFRLASFWVGVHYSPANKQVCMNLVPCVTVWVALPGGEPPAGPDYSTERFCDCNQGRFPCSCEVAV
ncbi:hypothetical protein GCM10009085_38540 [Pseudomonas avellanae]|nr:hypothetical protein GCM10009085_38540 [Pseudomonas avellanae]